MLEDLTSVLGKIVASGVEAPALPTSVDRFRLLAEAVRALCDAQTNDEIIETVRACARQLCGSTGIAIVLRDNDLCHYVAEDSAVALWTGQRFPMVACISGWAMMNRQQVLISDIYADPRVPHDAYRPAGIHSLVMTPVGAPEPFAALGAYWTTNRIHSAEEVAILQSLAQCMAAAFRTIELRDDLKARAIELEHRRALLEEARREVAFQARLLDIVEEAVIATDLEGRVVYWNAFAEKLYGWTKHEAIGKAVLDLNSSSDDGALAASILKELQDGKAWVGELTLRRKDGSTFPAYVRDWPVHDNKGALIGIVGLSWDNSEQRRIEQHQRLLINELNHRVKNSLTVVQSIAHQTLPSDGPTGEARDAFHERLHALAQAHGLVMESGWGPVSVRSLAETALEPFGYRAGNPRFDLQGSEIIFAPSAAITIALALHELGTNAAKYGALSNQTGRVSLAWRLEGEGAGERVVMEWRESGGPPVTAPLTRGFGSRLIERGLARELGGQVGLAFNPDGLYCRIEAPAEAVVLPAEAAAALAALTVVLES